MHLLLLVLLTKDPATMADLKALGERKEYAQVLERAEELPAAVRTDAWRAMVATAAAGVLPLASAEKNVFAQVVQADALRKRFAFLDKSQSFVSARDEAAMAGLRRCLRTNDDACFRGFAAYELTLTPAGSLAAGKLLRRNGSPPVRAMPLFGRAVGAKDAPSCKDADVVASTAAALETPEENDAAKAARQVAFEWCWSSMQPGLKAAMAGASSMRLQNVCRPMRAKQALTPKQDEACRDSDL